MLAMVKRTQAKSGAKSKFPVRVVSTKKVYSGPVFSVYSDQVQEGDYRGRRDVIRHPGSVVVLALEESDGSSPKVLLERQYRHAAKKRLWELPAGRIDSGESKLAAAKRELLEETGFTATRWQHAFQFYASPGFLDETMDVYMARGLASGQAQPEDDEQIAVRFFPLSQVISMVMNGSICDAKTISGVLWYERWAMSKD
jgi:ADP-ribose pyrophosphatase